MCTLYTAHVVDTALYVLNRVRRRNAVKSIIDMYVFNALDRNSHDIIYTRFSITQQTSGLILNTRFNTYVEHSL